uniref:Inner membrane protein n=1 Tax=Mesocestoides corti TaxID=53468 RepID=A0A5K3FS87_MESCO
MTLNPISVLYNIFSCLLADYVYCKKCLMSLFKEVVRLAQDSRQACQILRLAGFIFFGLLVTRALSYISNSIALSAFSDLIVFDVLFLLVALVSLWVRQRTADVKTYCFGYDRFEVIAVFASTILSIISSFYLLKEAIERIFEPAMVAAEYIPWTALICIGLHMISIYSIENPAFNHVTQASMSSWLQDQVADISRSLRNTIPGFSRILPPRMNPITLVGSLVVVVILFTYMVIDPTTEAGTLPDTVAAVVISLLLFNTMVPMAVYRYLCSFCVMCPCSRM